MKKSIGEISSVLILVFAFVCEANCQQEKTNELNTKDTSFLKDIIVSWDKTIDTTGLNIQFVLEMEKVKSPGIKSDPCGNSDFIVLYSDFSAMYFNMGCVWNFQKIYWVCKDDSLFFYSQEIGKNFKQNGLIKPKQIEKYLIENGNKMHVGTPAFGFDYLVPDSLDHYRAFNKSKPILSYSFNKKENISSCNLEYYKHAIKNN